MTLTSELDLDSVKVKCMPYF